MPHSLSRVLLLIFMVLVSPYPLMAQLQLGATLGGQSSYFLIDQIPSKFGEATSGARIGFQTGVAVQYRFGRQLSLRSGMTYQQHRINWAIKPFWLGMGEVYRFSYVSMPVVAQFTPTERWHIIAGIEAACLLMPPSETEQWQRFDYGVVLGAGFAILPQLHLNFEHFVGMPRVGEGRFLDEESNINGVYYFRNRSVRVSCIYYFCKFDSN